MLTQKCTNCGSYNDSSASVCYLCQQELPGAQERSKTGGKASPTLRAMKSTLAREYERPGCVGVYAILTLLSGLVGVFSALYLPMYFQEHMPDLLHIAYAAPGFDLDPAQFLSFLQSFVTAYSIVLLVTSALSILVGYGLWTMRNWARIYVLITQGFSLLLGLYLVFSSIVATQGNLFVVGAYVVAMLVPAVVFFWFFLNRRPFR